MCRLFGARVAQVNWAKWLNIRTQLESPRKRRNRTGTEEVFGDFVLLVFFRAALCDLGKDANAKIAGAAGAV
jgi:hypothetical protein